MKRRLVEYLACPECAGDLELFATAIDGVEIMSGELRCAACDVGYLIVGGVPRFSDPEHVEPDKAEIALNFGFEWKHFTQNDERYADQFLGWIDPVDAASFEDKVVLDGGCGKGRHLKLAAKWGARDVVGIDLSEAVDVAFAETKGLENVHVIQADIYRLPLKRVFDYAYSIGVIDHLPEPMAGFRSVASKVKPGGRFSVWICSAENNGWIESLITPVRERFTAHMQPKHLLQLSKIPTAIVYAASKTVYGPLNRSAAGRSVARRLFYNDYMYNISRFGWREHHNIIFDHLVAPTQFYVAEEHFKKWWSDIGVTDVAISWHNRNSWRGTGRIT